MNHESLSIVLPESYSGRTTDIGAVSSVVPEEVNQEQQEKRMDSYDGKEVDVEITRKPHKTKIDIDVNKGDSSMSEAAIIAALGNRNQPNLGDGFGMGGGMGLVALMALLARGGFGAVGERCGMDASAVQGQTIVEILSKLGATQAEIAAIPNAVATATLAQTNTILSQMNTDNLAQLMATAGVKDAVQNSALLSANAFGEIKTGIALSELRTTAAITGSENRVLAAIAATETNRLRDELAEERSHRRHDATVLSITNTNNNTQLANAQASAAASAQALALQQFLAPLCAKFDVLQHQVARAEQAVVQIGAGNVAGQTANPTNVGQV